MSNVKPTNLSTTTMATQTSELRQQVNAQPQKLAIPQPRSFQRPKSTTTVNRPQDQKQAPRNDGLQRVVTALKQEILDLKKGQNNLQSVTELKYIKGRVSSLEKSLAERDGTIATLRRELAEALGNVAQKEQQIVTLALDAGSAQDAANNPVGPGATSLDTAA